MVSRRKVYEDEEYQNLSIMMHFITNYFLVLEVHPGALRVYYWLSTRGSEGLGFYMPGIKPRMATYMSRDLQTNNDTSYLFIYLVYL